jgi:hypothetical protein
MEWICPILKYDITGSEPTVKMLEHSRNQKLDNKKG